MRQPGVRTRARRRIGAAVVAGLTAWLCLALAPAAQARTRSPGAVGPAVEPRRRRAQRRQHPHRLQRPGRPGEGSDGPPAPRPRGQPDGDPAVHGRSTERRQLPGQHPGGQRHRPGERHRGGAGERPVDGRRLAVQPHPAARESRPASESCCARSGGLIGGTKIIQQSGVQLRRNFGLDTIVNDFPQKASGLTTDITSLDLTLMGTANGHGFMRNPTSCTPKTVTFDAVSYGGHSAHGQRAVVHPDQLPGPAVRAAGDREAGRAGRHPRRSAPAPDRRHPAAGHRGGAGRRPGSAAEQH